MTSRTPDGDEGETADCKPKAGEEEKSLQKLDISPVVKVLTRSPGSPTSSVPKASSDSMSVDPPLASSTKTGGEGASHLRIYQFSRTGKQTTFELSKRTQPKPVTDNFSKNRNAEAGSGLVSVRQGVSL